MTQATTTETTDVLLVGGGIMSATLGALLTELEPTWNIVLAERLDGIGKESSSVWNNAGTGHSALCELNYAPQNPDGTVGTAKAVKINEQFQTSRQLWATMVSEGKLGRASDFINPVPHISMVFNDAHVRYLKARHEAFKQHKLFERMEYSEDRDQLAQWAPLTMRGRGAGAVAATFAPEGTDVNFGALTRQLVDHMAANGAQIRTGTQVTGLTKQSDGSWVVSTRNRLNSEDTREIRAKFVFVGAGGGALPLLQKSGIREIKGFGGFPVSGMWLRNTRPEIAEQHNAKVYGQASVGAPPMSVPHLDTRYENGKKSLLFGPYGGFKPNFLKQGSLLDLPRSVRTDNLYPMTRAGLANLDLVKYLISELLKNKTQRVEALQEYYPTADGDEWELVHAGQRVQVMRKDKEKGGVLQFGTELITAGDGSIAGLLGASPGASTAVPIMLDLLKQCFPNRHDSWQGRLTELIPAYGRTLDSDPRLADEIMNHTAGVLGIQ
ncbi:malate:quinone oxidoreductase [Kocuria coralli]|uniref:Probable malate:quinone oxidoreductase n=1 Tax=Kocuria coralli TaxID=1461025 RepID=A0A5J5L229_9MICC|nr:malate:quinone oxidoreductase [Kocuria coralli]KAA9395680.1 malate:quinone oxidoreductase [Kocuria coralli]